MRWFPLLLVPLLLVGLLKTAEAEGCMVPPDALALDAEEAAFLHLLNGYRAQNGAGSLVSSVNLNRAAQWFATDAALKGTRSHTSADGRSPWQRMRDCGYPTSGNGENMAWGGPQLTAQGVFNAWKNSPGHNANMLNPNFIQIGIGRHIGGPLGLMWVTDFASYNDGTNALATQPPTPTRTPTRTPTPPPVFIPMVVKPPACVHSAGP